MELSTGDIPRRWARIRISAELIVSMFSGDELHGHRVENPIPRSTAVRMIKTRGDGTVDILLEDDSFQLVNPGDEIPQLTPVFTRLD